MAPGRHASLLALMVSVAMPALGASPSPTSKAAPTSSSHAATTTTTTTTATTTPTATTTTGPAVSEAVALEEAAFVAVDEEQWCLAMHLFVKADEAAPALPLIENAANAAEYAGDFEQAAMFLQVLVEREEGAAKKKTRKAAAWKLKVRSKGKASTSCPSLEVLRPPPPPEPVPEPEPVVAKAPPPPPPLVSPALAAIIGGVGVVAALGGGVVMGVGALPYVDHARAVTAINEAEAQKADARDLQTQQQAARDAWESWGQLSVMSGGVLVGLGVSAAVAGGVLVVTQQGSAE